MDEIKDMIVFIINEAVTVDADQVNTIVNHLISPSIGVTSIEDLADVDMSMLGPNQLGALQVKRILAAFKNDKGTTDRPSPSNTSQESTHNGDEDEEEDEELRREKFRDDEFQFHVNWNDIPKRLIKNLKAATRKNEEGSQEDIAELRKALVIKIESKYDIFRNANPLVIQKTPGVKVYRDVSRQVVKELGCAMAVMLNKKVMCKGVATLTKFLTQQIENDYRTVPSSGEPASFSRGKGVPGVLDNEYLPSMSKKERKRALRLQKELQGMATIDEQDKDWVEIASKMTESYPLQREMIVHCTKTIITTEEADAERSEDEDEDEDDLPEEKLIEKVKSGWPFLFSLKAMCNHHQRLTGRDLQEKLDKFFDSDDIKFLIAFLTSCSSANKTNAIMRLQMDEMISLMTNGSKLLLAVAMVANHFKEEWDGTLLLTAERTTEPEEVEASVEDLPSSICIVAKGENAFSATAYFICIDKVCVANTSSAGNALLMLIQLCFILDLEYPKGLSKTFEFFERIILEMTPQETRVRNTKGKVLLVLSNAVGSVGKAYFAFMKQARDNLREINN